MSELYRQELKYSIHTLDRDILHYRLRSFMTPDVHADADGGYWIRSLYFDDTDFSAYHEKISGIKERTKYRIRMYNYDTDYIILEKKERNGDLCRKVTERIDIDIARRLMAGEPSGLRSELGLEFDAKHAQGLHPVVLVDYYRYAFSCPYSDTRLTLDSRLSSPGHAIDFFDTDLLLYPVFDEEEALIELKFSDRPPDYVIDLLSDIPKDRLAVSKYTRCLAMPDD